MRQLKTYDVIVVTTDRWAGSVQAHSRAAAKRLAEDAFNEGQLQQCDEDIDRVEILEVRP